MSKAHHEPRVINLETQRVPYYKEKSQIKVRWNQFLHNVRYFGQHWRYRIYVRSAVGILVYTAGLYTFIYNIYGNEHPLNRYQWRRMKKNGQLSEEMLHKEEILRSFVRSKLNSTFDSESVYSLQNQGSSRVF
ncbi:unnamed protein product [Thelazia callipaeda]|uniref:Complex I-B15 n=1 Tax=Thelazia callipaeda TaxID=103827 RepID=A0A0N5CVX5_THECL|nr:unnamed protein product [Thelazia callipaeda]